MIYKRSSRMLETEFDMTPIIDVVFLLIIFFMLVCQFIAAEQFEVQVPDAISSAQQQETDQPGLLTISVLPDSDRGVIVAIGSEKLASVTGEDLAMLVESAVNEAISSHPAPDKTVRLRCDKSVSFGQVKYILAGISRSHAEMIDWAVLNGR